MAKRSQKRSVQYEKDQSGCMWSLISIFDFRHGRPARKLLLDSRHGSKHFGSGLLKNKFEIFSNLDETEQVTAFDGEETSRAEVTTDTGKFSVKKLIDEEMSNEKGRIKDTSKVEVERNQSESAQDSQIRRDHKGTKKTWKKSHDMDAFDSKVPEILQNDCSCDQNLAQHSSKLLGVDEMIHELCCKIHSESNQRVKCDLNGETYVLPDHKHYDIKEILGKAMKDFINQKLINGKHLTEDQKSQSSRELIDVLKLISSDEKAFLKLLQDPNSLLVEYVQNLKEAHADDGEEPKLESEFSEQKLVNLRKSKDVVNNKRQFFRRTKSQEVNSFEANEFSNDSNRIVILKPGFTSLQDSETKTNIASSPVSHISVKGSSDRVGSHFFFSKIKRKLKQAIGKQHNEVSTSEISNRVGMDNTGNKSPSKEHFYIERVAKPSMVSKRANTNGRRNGSEISGKHEIDDVSNKNISNIYIEAKKHLSEMLNNGDDGLEPLSRQVPITLGKILSLSEYSPSPTSSPVRGLDIDFVTAQMRFSANEKLQLANENSLSPKCELHVSPLGQEAQNSKSESPVSVSSPDYEAPAPNINSSVQEGTLHDIDIEETAPSPCEEEMNPTGDLGLVKEDTVISFAPCESSSCPVTRDEQNVDTSKLCDDKKLLESVEQEDSIDENQPQFSPLASPCFLTHKKVADLESSIDISERPSPDSVLEPLFTEDNFSPSKTISELVGTTIQPLRIEFDEPETSASDQAKCAKPYMEENELVFECVKLVMVASDFNWDEFYRKWLSSDLLLDPSLVDEVEFFSNQLCCDQKLLFDCINEVLVEVCEHYFGCSPLLSFVKLGIRPLPNMKSVILEISEGVYWHLLQLPLPITLDQIVIKDMARTGTWLDLRFDTETIGFDLGEVILGDLIEDIVLSYAKESPKCNQGVLPQLNGNECNINS